VESKKLIIQIPCHNEESTLPVTIAAISRIIEGVTNVEIMIINDGSTDNTLTVARSMNVDHILDIKQNKGLANAFLSGIFEAARLGADYVVNLDADNQYCADDIPLLLEPLLLDQADMVVGERNINNIETFSWLKKKLQIYGSGVIRLLSNTNIRDTPSGFRALNRKAMLKLHIFNEYTYTHESLIAAVESGLAVKGVSIRTNPEVLRKSRLVKNNVTYILKSGFTVVRFYFIYNPYPLFISLSSLTGLMGLFLLFRFLYFYFIGLGDGWIQSLIISGILIFISVFTLIAAIICDIARVNRKLLQKILYELRVSLLSKEK
jgi:glycosyltransferase involved in cell wall biosynthesis